MMGKKYFSGICLFYILLLSLRLLFAQQDSIFAQWAEWTEDNGELAEYLQQLTENPINLNEATETEFEKIPFLNSRQIDQILTYRKEHQKFKSRRPLYKILGGELYPLLKPFFTIKINKKRTGYLKENFVFPIDSDPATKKYLGGAWSNYGKFYFGSGTKYKLGLVSQKDIGEGNFLDYLSGYFSYSNPNWQVIAGRYRLHYAHGLAFSNPFANQKSAAVLNALRNIKTSVLPSLSSSENNGLFGICIGRKFLSDGQLILFASQNEVDARTGLTSAQITGIDYDGYHRTVKELAHKNLLSERISGLVVSKDLFNNLKLLLLLSHLQYNPGIEFKQPYVTESEQRRQHFHFSGNKLNQASISYNSERQNLQLSGELCLADVGSPGYSQKILFTEDNVQFGCAYWKLGKNYQAPHGTVFNRSAPSPSAQQGLYLASQLRLSRQFVLKGYKFYVKDLWRGYFNNMPETKDEWYLESSYSVPQKTVHMRIRTKTQTTAASNSNNAGFDLKQTIYRLQFDWHPLQILTLKTRFAHTILHHSDEHGSYLFQDIKLDWKKRLRLYSRITFFETSSFGTALYEYENDLPGSYSNYPLYGQGHKWYLMLYSQLGKNLRVWAKLRYYKRGDRLEHVSTLNRDIRFQIEWFI